MITNFTHNYKFSTRLYLNNKLLDCISQIKLLGVEITEDLSWKANTSAIIKKAYSRMSLLTKLAGFDVPVTDLTIIYIIYIRSLTDYCAVLWHSTITEEEKQDIERIQKCAIKVILQEKYTNYKEGLDILNLEELSDRRENTCLKFALSCSRNPRTSSWFPLSMPNEHNVRKHEMYLVTPANTERFRLSTIPYLQRLLNRQ